MGAVIKYSHDCTQIRIYVTLTFIGMLGGRDGLSSRKSHYMERSNCLNMLSNLYGYLPLVNSTIVVSKF